MKLAVECLDFARLFVQLLLESLGGLLLKEKGGRVDLGTAPGLHILLRTLGRLVDDFVE